LRQGLEQASFGQRQQLVELLIDRVIVSNEEVEIRYVIPTSEASLQTRFCQLRTDYLDPPAHDQPGRESVRWCAAANNGGKAVQAGGERHGDDLEAAEGR
jgi:hypothetical protein